MLARAPCPDAKNYASKRVFDGTRPLSADRVATLIDEPAGAERQPPVPPYHWGPFQRGFQAQAVGRFAYALRPRFNGACPRSPAVDILNGQIAGTSITAMCASARSQDASATRLTRTHGNGIAASIRVRIRANIRAIPPRPSTKPAPISSAPGAAFLPNRTEADFQAWRDQQAWTAEKYRRFDRGERMPPDWKPSHAAAG